MTWTCRTLLPLSLLLAALPVHAQGNPLDDVLTGLAVRLAEDADVAGLERIGVPEFANSRDGLGGETGALGHYVADQLQLRLVRAADGRFEVVERRRLATVLEEGRIQASGLTSPETGQELIGAIDGLDGLLVGSLTRLGTSVAINVQLVALPTAAVKGGADGRAALDADLIALLGEVVPAPRRQARPEPVRREDVRQAAVRHRQDRPAPLTGGAYELEVLTGDAAKPLYVDGDDYFVGFEPGETYRLRLTNRTTEPVAVALFVDGLNTLEGEREVPSQARKWILQPQSSAIIPGWQYGLEEARQFLVAGFADSLAARQRFTDQIGLITASFFPPADGTERRGALGTTEGLPVESRVRRVEFQCTERPAAVLAIRYDAQETVERLERVGE